MAAVNPKTFNVPKSTVLPSKSENITNSDDPSKNLSSEAAERFKMLQKKFGF